MKEVCFFLNLVCETSGQNNPQGQVKKKKIAVATLTKQTKKTQLLSQF